MAYRGYVDEISRQRVIGWAADSLSPDGAIDVIILVNGEKIAQIPCNRPRADLVDLGIYGKGNHGFSHEFAPPLDDSRDWRIGVRFANSGQPVRDGDAVLKRGEQNSAIVGPPAPLVVAGPTDPASLFRTLALYEADRGLYELLCRIDFANIRADHLEYSVFGEVKQTSNRNGAWNDNAARDYLNELLSSVLFQENIVGSVLQAFPEKRRIFFVHIPKCAGTDLSLHLAARYPLIPARWQNSAWTSREQLFVSVARLVHETPFSDSILAAGHVRLSYYIDKDLIRPADTVFTVVRDPFDIAISAINDMFTKMQAGITRGEIQPDVQEWMALLNLRKLPPEVTSDFVSDITPQALHTPEIVLPNPLCYWLGGGTADEVIRRLARYHVEITTTAKYNPWLALKWGITNFTRENQSTKYLLHSRVSEDDIGYLSDLSSEDRILYDLIGSCIENAGLASITGGDLLKYAGM